MNQALTKQWPMLEQDERILEPGGFRVGHRIPLERHNTQQPAVQRGSHLNAMHALFMLKRTAP